MKTLFVSNDPTIFDEASPALAHLAQVGDLPSRLVRDLEQTLQHV